MGRNSFEVKICACPGRDRTTDEKKLAKEKLSGNSAANNPETTKTTKTQPQTQKAKQGTTAPVLANGTQEAPKPKDKYDQISIKSICLPNEEENQEIFTIKVRGRKNYEILKNLNEALEIQQRMYSKLKNNNENDATAGTAAGGKRFV